MTERETRADDDAPHDLAYFVDVTTDAGIDFVHTSGGDPNDRRRSDV